MTRVPGCPKELACACWNCFSKMYAFSSAGTYFQLASGAVSLTVTVDGPVAVIDLTSANENATSEPAARS